MRVDKKTAAFFDAVYESPDDDAPRRALARALTANEDPRGEFISLQLLPAPSATERKRAAALLKKHGAAWLEPLQGALRKASVKWARGFPVEGHLALKPGRDDAQLRSLATLRSLDLEPSNVVLSTELVERLVFEAPLRHLRVLRGLRRALLPKLLRAKPSFAIETLEVPGEGGGGIEGERAEQAFLPKLHAAFAEGKGLPNLRELTLSFAHPHGRDPQTWAWLWETKSGQRLERLRMNVGESVLPAWLDALDAHGEALALEELVLFGRHELTLARTAKGFTRLRGALGAQCFPQELVQFEKTLKALGKRVETEVEGRRTR